MTHQTRTPGEWYARQSDELDFVIANGPIDDKGRVHLGTSFIAKVFRSCTAERTRADARLIAAAPDLLDACQLAVTHVDDEHVAQALITAIAKATGVYPRD